MTSEVQKFANRLNEVLDEVGMPRMGKGRQTALADEMREDPQVVGQWLKGEAFPRTSQLVRLSQYLGVRSNWLLTGAGDRHPAPQQEAPTETPMVREAANGSYRGEVELSKDAFEIAVAWMKLPLQQRKALRKVIVELAASQ